MTAFDIVTPLRGLARALCALRDRVREALAGEVGRAASDAVGRALAGGERPVSRR